MSQYARRKKELQQRANQKFNNATGNGNAYGREIRPGIPDNARTIKLKMTLLDHLAGDGKVKIFGAVRNASNKAFNAANNTKVELINGDYDELIQSLLSGDIMRIGSAKMNVINDAQAEKDFNIVRKKYNQTGQFVPVSPADARSPKDNNPNLLET